MLEHPDDVIIKLQGVLEKARDVRSQLEADVFGGTGRGGYEFPEAALEGYLEEAETLLEMILEARGLPLTRLRLIEKWAALEKEGLTHTIPYPEVGYLESKPLSYLEKITDGLRMVLGRPQDPWESYELRKLESLLRKTATILKREKIAPENEHDIQVQMNKYLEACFAEYVKNVHIPGGITTFKPDGGIRNLKAAIEFKFASTRDEVSRSLRGIFEDVTGYKGSADWTRFYSVVYQTEAFESEEKFRHDLARAGAMSWIPILVTGKGRRRKTEAKK
ncbi:MAG: hypothetical protein JWQ87_2284 [Candidatus Sulfotelmatobacter sp.]|nr:hypothetical protein [Candidatus Sulfotelmatobacter sp.]